MSDYAFIVFAVGLPFGLFIVILKLALENRKRNRGPKNCGTCRFWASEQPLIGPQFPPARGLCKFLPPVLAFVENGQSKALRPLMGAEDECGQFRRR